MNILPNDTGDETLAEGTAAGEASHQVDVGYEWGEDANARPKVNGTSVHQIGYKTGYTVRNTIANAPEVSENPERMEAREFFERHLLKNVQTIKILREMEDVIQDFKSCAPILLVWKCVDGRVHGSKGKGYPIGTIVFGRTEGAKFQINSNNARLRQLIEIVVSDAAKKTPGMPAVVILLGHQSKKDEHLCCAACSYDPSKSLQVVEQQAQQLRTEYYDPKKTGNYDPQKLFIIHGITNTDDTSEKLVFKNGETIDSGDLIDELTLNHPSEVFSEKFLNSTMHDPTTRKYTKDLTGQQMLEGTEAPIYQNLRVSLAMEAFLMRRISEAVNKYLEDPSDESAFQILNKAVFDKLMTAFKGINGLPHSLYGPLLYQSIWNIAYALYQRERLSTMEPSEQKEHLDHFEDLVCYGEGFETLSRNKAILVKPYSGDEVESLRTAHGVLMKYSKMKHMPMVHINVEVNDKFNSWNSFNKNVLSEVKRMKRNVTEIFHDKVHILCSYSFKDEKKFYPIVAQRDDMRECMSMDMTENFESDKDFSGDNLRSAESAYTIQMLQRHETETNGVKA